MNEAAEIADLITASLNVYASPPAAGITDQLIRAIREGRSE